MGSPNCQRVIACSTMERTVEEIRLKTHKNQSCTAQAEISRTSSSQRLTKALAIGVGGTLFGLATIIIPVAHLITVWAIPLFSIFVALNVYRMGPKILRLVGTCPSCGAPIEETNLGNAANDLWIRCPSCNEALQPEVGTKD